jgi:hypothetical protein
MTVSRRPSSSARTVAAVKPPRSELVRSAAPSGQGPQPRRLLGGEYLFRPGGRVVVVLDFEFCKTGRTGRVVVVPVGTRVSQPWAAWPSELDELPAGTVRVKGEL